MTGWLRGQQRNRKGSWVGEGFGGLLVRAEDTPCSSCQGGSESLESVHSLSGCLVGPEPAPATQRCMTIKVPTPAWLSECWLPLVLLLAVREYS